MYKLVELEKDNYEKFVKPHKSKSHFLQSYAWGEFLGMLNRRNPYYLGLLNRENKVVAAALLLEKKLPLGFSYFYSPRGFVLDYNDSEIFNEMTEKVIKFVKSKKGIFLKIDPDIIKSEYNYLDEEVSLNNNYEKIFEMIKKAGFKHLGFTKNFETSEPRYTFRIDLEQDLDTIISHFSKTTKQRIKKAEKLDTKVRIGDKNDLDIFCHLMNLTEDRKDFVSYPDSYYKTLYDVFNKDNKMTLFIGSVNLEKILDDLKSRKEELQEELKLLPKKNMSKSAKNKEKEFTRQLDKVKSDISKYEKYYEDYGKEVTLNAHMIIEYGNKAWVIYAGNENILTETCSNYRVYFEHLKYCKERNLKIYDQFGTIGDLRKDNPRMGLHEFKKKFGGDYVEFLGEFDYVTNHFMYFVFTKLVPIYRKIIRNKSRKELHNDIKRNR